MRAGRSGSVPFSTMHACPAILRNQLTSSSQAEPQPATLNTTRTTVLANKNTYWLFASITTSDQIPDANPEGSVFDLLLQRTNALLENVCPVRARMVFQCSEPREIGNSVQPGRWQAG